MTKKFHIERQQVLDCIKDDVVPISAEHVIISICQRHMLCMVDFDDDIDDEFDEDDHGYSEEETGYRL
jgi:hypothetical protein